MLSSRSRFFPYIWLPMCWKCVPRDIDLFTWNSAARNPWDAGAINDGAIPLLSFSPWYQVFWINMNGMTMAKYGPMHLSVGRDQFIWGNIYLFIGLNEKGIIKLLPLNRCENYSMVKQMNQKKKRANEASLNNTHRPSWRNGFVPNKLHLKVKAHKPRW